MTDLINQCLALHKDARARLADILKDSLNKKELMNINCRFHQLLRVATELLGFGIDSKCRDASCVIGRMLIVYKMRQEGYSTTQIGIVLGRSHSSVIHLERKMEDVFMYPDAFKIEIAYWNMFVQTLKEYGIN